ncbi:hypothetical protein PFICI_08824 [Pestalotiopsis fici W106-1]|uniref:NAD-dependent epimerase/dehydratase domain-containing protein n=1 Tax=Pestalotiopsis fici (strain W106-1 / CGMCC3.15140) TaxID=1229662 RepID=W3X1C8_PESFW|nr:uncharacterized protein PFICI_08824 [Pestalotiopsis fici W106-1]ETS78971.1 hypothetical protein PFICI_08824 [Pestalotiopsis fici W106-1]
MSSSSKRVLLTGANGYLAQHILSQLLSAGHSVRGVVRNSSKVSQLRSSPSFSSYPASQLDFAVVADITATGAFDTALRSDRPFDWVIHTASPFNYRRAAEATGSSNADNFLDPAVKGTTEILSGVHRIAPTVCRVVLTSSTAAVFNWEKGNPLVTQPARVYSGRDWNPIAQEEGLTTTNAVRAYQASKTFAEKAAWEFITTAKPGFDLVVLNPPMIYGPLLDAAQLSRGPQDLNQSTWNIYSQLLDPSLKSTDPVPPTNSHLYVDVRDAARAHLLAASTPEAGGKRFVICAGEMSMQRIANILRETLSEKKDTIPKGTPDDWKMEEGRFMASSADAENILGLEFRSPESTIEDMGRQMVALEKKAVH